ncbi:MAG: hypothetical protein CBB80_005905 [Synechococcus sp. TMED20]|nr:MAG: hypothetical protein CBB80_005905 [Synechococcus sp. TMED20]
MSIPFSKSTITSLPDEILNVSLPDPPIKKSSPPLPNIVSSPSPPEIIFEFESPINRSSEDEP